MKNFCGYVAVAGLKQQGRQRHPLPGWPQAGSTQQFSGAQISHDSQGLIQS
jgi:hypothetical protein